MLVENHVANNTPTPANQRNAISQDRLLINSSSARVLLRGDGGEAVDKTIPSNI